jgi:hypothetical protein
MATPQPIDFSKCDDKICTTFIRCMPLLLHFFEIVQRGVKSYKCEFPVTFLLQPIVHLKDNKTIVVLNAWICSVLAMFFVMLDVGINSFENSKYTVMNESTNKELYRFFVSLISTDLLVPNTKREARNSDVIKQKFLCFNFIHVCSFITDAKPYTPRQMQTVTSMMNRAKYWYNLLSSLVEPTGLFPRHENIHHKLIVPRTKFCKRYLGSVEVTFEKCVVQSLLILIFIRHENFKSFSTTLQFYMNRIPDSCFEENWNNYKEIVKGIF